MVGTLSACLFASIAAVSTVASAIPVSTPPTNPPPAISFAKADQSDFDFEIGTWTTTVRLLRNPLSGEAPDWAEYVGTSNVKALQGGRANLVELSVNGPKGKIEGIAFRLYNPQARQWSLNYANLRNGLLTAPLYGGFGSGRGVFYGQDVVDGRAILMRFIITKVSARETHFEQSFSADGGKTWELNWYAVDTLR